MNRRDADQQARFELLWNDFLEGDLDESGQVELQQLVDRHPDFAQQLLEDYQLHRLLGIVHQHDEQNREAFVHSTLQQLPKGSGDFVEQTMEQIEKAKLAWSATGLRSAAGTWSAEGSKRGTSIDHRGKSEARNSFRLLRHPLAWTMTIGLLLLVVFGLTSVWLRSQTPNLVTITEMQGPCEVIEVGHRQPRILNVGEQVSASTIRLLSAESWLTFEYADQSTVTLAGLAKARVVAGEQKRIELEDGRLAASVTKQPAGEPMMIETPTAELTVLGTRFMVDADTASTRLDVSEGKVRVVRVVDQQVATVPAEHHIVASASQLEDFEAIRRQTPVSHWFASIPRQLTLGIWLPAQDAQPPSISTVQIEVPREGELQPLHVCCLSATRGQTAPVVLTSGARLRIRGRMSSTGELIIGLTTHHATGGMAGKYMISHHSAPQTTLQEFELDLPVSVLKPLQTHSPRSVDGLELVDFWCGSFDLDSQLWIESVQLVPAGGSAGL